MRGENSSISVPVKILFLLTVYFLHGRPFEGIGDYGYAFFVAYILTFGLLRERIKPILVIMGLVFLMAGRLMPQLEIPEQQRILMGDQQDFIPPGQFLKDESKYPFFMTADGYVQGYKDKRIVRTIDIDSGIYSLRSGWINSPHYNFYYPASPHVRENLPFVVYYEITPQMKGMTLNLEGLLVFEKNGRLKIHDPAVKTLALQDLHIGSKLCGFGGQWDERGFNNLKIQLEKTRAYQLYDIARFLSFFFGLGLLFSGLFFIPWTVDFGIESFLLSLSAISFWLDYRHVFRWGIFARGGMDGVAHDGYTYWMLEKWAGGNWFEALMSPEKVFYFMPGMRYVRFMESLLFGNAYILQVTLLIFVPLILYRFFSIFLSRIAAICLVLLTFSYMLNGMGLSIKLYVKSLLDLYGEGFAYSLLFISLTILAKSIQKVGWGLVAFFLLAISLSIRPNLAVFVGIIAAIHLFTTTFSRQDWLLRFLMLFGLSPLILIPLHNVLGGEFVLVTKASQIPENLPLSPGLYFQAIGHLLGFNETFNQSSRFIVHFQHVHSHYILAWFVCLWLLFKGQTPVLRTFALATFAGLSVHFFYLPELRYLHPYLTIAIVLGLYQIPLFRVKEPQEILCKAKPMQNL
jgi:hypothetical protein